MLKVGDFIRRKDQKANTPGMVRRVLKIEKDKMTIIYYPSRMKSKFFFRENEGIFEKDEERTKAFEFAESFQQLLDANE